MIQISDQQLQWVAECLSCKHMDTGDSWSYVQVKAKEHFENTNHEFTTYYTEPKENE